MGGNLILIVVIRMGMVVSNRGRDALAMRGLIPIKQVSWFLLDFLAFLFYCDANNRFIA
jgi:hypothetical protein